jgi:hypothetical protein
MMDPEAMTAEDLRRQVEEAEREAERRDLVARFHRAKATLAGSKRDHTGQIWIHPLGQAVATYAATPGGPYVGIGPSLSLPKRKAPPIFNGKNCREHTDWSRAVKDFFTDPTLANNEANKV